MLNLNLKTTQDVEISSKFGYAVHQITFEALNNLCCGGVGVVFWGTVGT